MTDADPKDVLTVTTDGVTVEKSFEPDDFPVPAIAFSIESERDEPISIQLADTVPQDVMPENIGFHPKYGAEFWGVKNGRIIFERELAPGEEYTTVYGLRGGDTNIAEKFMTEPTLEFIEAPSEGPDEEIDSVLDAAAIDPVDAEGDTDDDPTDETAESTETVSGNGIGSEAESTELADGTDESATEDDEEVPALDLGGTDAEPNASGDQNRSESIVSALAAELREKDVDDDDLLELRDALGLDMGTASVEARMEHLQSEVADLSAYTNALEAFLDEEGDAQTLITEVSDNYDETTDRIDDMETELDGIQSDIEDRFDAIDDRVGSVEGRIETVEDRLDSEVDGLDDELEALDDRIEDESEAREDIESELTDLSDELADVAEMRDRLASALGGLAGGSPAEESDSDESDTDTTSADSDDETASEETDTDDT